MKLPYTLIPTVVAVAVTPFQMATALSSTEVSAVAEAVTVRIDGQNPGSGVLIKRQGDVYTVLTAAHVVETEDEYELVTIDGQQHPLVYSRIKKVPNVDLALVEFTSSKSYRVAELGNSITVKAGASVYVSGFPLPTAAITQSIWNFSEGKITANAKRALADGYSLVYSNNTLPGMSGGAVLDDQGKLIGVHGRADAEQQVQRRETVFIKTGFNLGIPIHTFLNLAAVVSPELGFTNQTTVPETDKLTEDDWYLQGVDQYKKGEYRGAIAAFSKAISLNPEDDNSDAYLNRGHAYLSLKDYPQVVANYSKVIALEPGDTENYLRRGVIYILMGKPTQGKKDLQVANEAYKRRDDLKSYNNSVQMLKALDKIILIQRSDPDLFEKTMRDNPEILEKFIQSVQDL